MAELCNVSESSVYRIIQNKENYEQPKEKKKKGVKYECDSFCVAMIRRVTQEFYANHHYPTVETIWKKCLENEHFPQVKKRTFYTWLIKHCKFKFKRTNKKPVYLERPDIVSQREYYLRSIRKYREQGYKIYYSDETWCSPDQARNKIWHMFLTNEEARQMQPIGSNEAPLIRDMDGYAGK